MGDLSATGSVESRATPACAGNELCERLIEKTTLLDICDAGAAPSARLPSFLGLPMRAPGQGARQPHRRLRHSGAIIAARYSTIVLSAA
jgi:hypothetical protein